MLGVVMGHHLGRWWWALVAVHVDTLLLHSIVIVIVIACHRHASIVACRHCASIIIVLCGVESRR